MKRGMRWLFDFLVNFYFIYFLLHVQELSFCFQFFSFNNNFDFIYENIVISRTVVSRRTVPQMYRDFSAVARVFLILHRWFSFVHTWNTVDYNLVWVPLVRASFTFQMFLLHFLLSKNWNSSIGKLLDHDVSTQLTFTCIADFEQVIVSWVRHNSLILSLFVKIEGFFTKIYHSVLISTRVKVILAFIVPSWKHVQC